MGDISFGAHVVQKNVDHASMSICVYSHALNHSVDAHINISVAGLSQ